ncbi:site-specific DNA-methyltransferase [Klebsiella michiganensis]|uniref:site-specific DNA-methyltransferase (adenine-specific) n=1 Tax=Klebsiella huaxiensis TaxID=2153354 RepID=A0ABT6E6R6_9ENTR|nr:MULTISPECIES: site-specific DNA-methyltransferase [Klebsiella]AKL34418.1 DNA methyltransferase [Klebsiella oxytoca]MBE0113683.1 site-specific DNA-methyltransferase [Klebsiella michiganensis]MBE0137014.1 site-specific DNA-methyltransferase [Klebsiella michiganensis]MBE0203515.1 site-specific DNA-methyltransferase [Klebsiella michiganensis]MBG8568833.1 site-specific DNA-methyltransferase [Klebsiella michiganensis]
MDKLKMHSPNLVEQNIDKLAALFPNCVTESKDENGKLKQAIDFDLLKQELSRHIVDGPQERYQLNWPGKREALLTANAPIAKTLRPCREESVNFDTTRNLFIEGDNLDALKLLQETYLGKVKMIYIDPPYNTGRDFIYDDDYSSDIDTYLRESNQLDEKGQRLVSNTDANGRFHSDWLSMIFARLRLARNLLKDDGVIFISIDDNEVDNLRKVCNEVFGEDNFIAQIIWQKVFSPKNSARWFSEDHDYILVYARNSSSWTPNLLPQTDEMIARYKNPDNDPRGVWQSDNLTARNKYDAGLYAVTCPSGKIIEAPPKGSYWRVSYNNFQKLNQDNRIWWGVDGNNMPRLKRFLSEVKQGRTPQTLWFYKDVGHTQDAKKTLLKYVPFEYTENMFNSVKPVELLQRIIQLSSSPNDNDIILDFFSGSATTAHAVIKQNVEDGGNRCFIGIQISEPFPIPETGMSSIFDMGLVRIKNVTKEIAEQSDTNSSDLGFRVLRIDTSNMSDIYYTPDAVTQDDLFDQVENVKSNRTEEDLLFQVMIDWGVDLTLPIRRETIANKKVFFVDTQSGNSHGALVACFDKTGGIDEDFIKQLAAFSPLRLVFRDAGFASDAAKTNAEQLLKQLSATTDVKTI